MISLADRALPWSPLSVNFDDGERVSTHDMLQRAGLAGWDVRVESVPIPDGYSSDKEYFWTTRNSLVDPTKRDIFNNVGSRYNPLQNEELYSFGDNLLGGGKWVGGGQFKGGRVVFGSLKLDNHSSINGSDIDMYLVVSTSHDGSLAVTAAVTPINPYCYNSLIASISRAKQKWSIRHTSSLDGKMQAARETLGLADNYIDLWTEFMTPLAESEVTDARFDEIINKAFAPAPDASKHAHTRWDKRYSDYIDVWYSDTIQGTPFQNTQFAVWNALNEVHGWGLAGRGDNASENAAVARSGFSATWNAENDRLLAIARCA